MAEKNVTVLVALVEHSSQELCDLHRKAANLDSNTVLEGGHNIQVQRSIRFCCVVLEKKKKTQLTHWLKPSDFSFSPSVKLAKTNAHLLSINVLLHSKFLFALY